ncbi:MAG: CesT family type III secretion system chaperone [Chlamydiae bacterium]|nr:CesT family type III secretion system chaperone [Chlamydiota bacterium]
MNKFDNLIVTLGEMLDTDLRAEKGVLCKLKIDGKLSINLEYDEVKDLILMGTLIVELPAGRFRENILKEALRMNSIYPRIGTFAYSERANKLALFQYISFTSLSADAFNIQLHQFIDFSYQWFKAIDSGNLLSVALPPSGSL